MKQPRPGTFDSSFWVHAVYLDLVDFILSDFELVRTKEVERELGRDNSTSLRLKAILTDKSMKTATPESAKINLYGDTTRESWMLLPDQMILAPKRFL